MRVWHSFIRFPMRVYEYLDPSTLISRITNDSIIVGTIVEQVINILSPIITMVLFVQTMLTYSEKLTWTVIPVILLYTVMLMVGQNWIYSIFFQLQETLANLTGFLAEKLGNIRLIKASATEAHETRHGQDLNYERFRVSMKSAKFSITLESFQSVMDLLLTGLVIIYGSKLISDGEMDIAGLISFYLFSMNMPNYFQMVLLSIMRLQETKGSTTIVSELSNLEQEELTSEHPFPEQGGDLVF